MAVSGLMTRVVLLISLTHQALCYEFSDVCIRYKLKGVCDLIVPKYLPRPTVLPEPDGALGYFCRQACKEDESHLYNDICDCVKPTTATTPTTTVEPCMTSFLEGKLCNYRKKRCRSRTCIKKQNQILALQRGIGTCECPRKEVNLPPPCDRNANQTSLCNFMKELDLVEGTTECLCIGPTSPLPPLDGACYYSFEREAGDLSRRKRLYSGNPVAPTCEYPGIVGIFKDVGTPDQRSICTSVLVDESTIIVSAACKDNIHEDSTYYVLVDSNNVSAVTKKTQVQYAPLTPLSDHFQNQLYFMKLNPPVTFDTGCVLPACVPNNIFTPSDVDLDDCRLVGYGDVDEDLNTFIGKQPDTLQEIAVKVDVSSINSGNLKVTRVDGKDSIVCWNDDSAPLMCTLKDSKEWVVVGVTITTGFPCSTQDENSGVVIANLLDHATNTFAYYPAVSHTTYANEEVLLRR